MVGTMQGTANKKIEILKRLQLSEQHMSKPMLYVAVINYESVWREQIFDTIKKWNPDMIICDESQRIKSNSAQQSKAMHALGDIARYKLILSGTPIQNSAMDVWSQYRFLDKTVFGDNFYSFRARYGVLGGFNGKQVVGVRDVDLLTEIVAVPGLMALNTTLKEVSSDDNNLPVPPPSVLNPFTYCNILAS